MKIIHTSDWHIGHKLYEKSREKEHKLFFKWLHKFIEENSVELLLVSGDIFDSAIPSNSSLKLYYDFLISLQDTKCKSIIITAGNHDSPNTLEAPKELLNALNISVIGKVDENIDNMLFPIKGSNIIVVAIPFLRDKDIRSAISNESFNDINKRYKKALINYYNKLATRCKEINRDNFFIAMGHLFATNTTISGSESSIYIGGLGDISVDDFPNFFDYIALGHLHKSQKVGGVEHIRYSGSPIPLSFNEAKQNSKVTLLNIENGKIESIKEIVVPKFRDLISIKTSFNRIKEILNSIKKSSNLTPWIDIILTDKNRDFNLNKKIVEIVKNLDLEVLRVSIDSDKEFNYIKDNKIVTTLSSFTPEKIFEKKCKEEKFTLEDNIEIKDIFYEILSDIREDI